MNIFEGLQRISERKEVQCQTPEGLKRRCSVAIIVRMPDMLTDDCTTIEHWLQQVDKRECNKAEVMFIKRAASDRDRWSSHIAMPGGKRDPEDESDLSCAIRETWEEVGLDLQNDALYVGPLDQRLIKVSFGSKAIMTLCPYVFVMKNPAVQVNLQPTEIATAFWHPVSELYSPDTQSYETVSVGDRMSSSWTPGFLKKFIKWSVGDLLFGSVTLKPYSLLHKGELECQRPPYRLWGLTLAYLADFLELCNPGYYASGVVKVPTTKAWDMRLLVRIMSKGYVKQRFSDIQRTIAATNYASGHMDFVSKLLDGYFWYLSKGIVLTLVLRGTIIGALVYQFALKKRLVR